MENALTTNSAPAMLPVNASPVEMRADAARFPRIQTIPREDAIRQMTDVVRAAMIYRGAKPEANEVAVIAVSLVDELLADTHLGLRYISFGEIRRAVRTAVLETEMYGVNVASLYRAIVAYAKGEGQQASDRAALLKKTTGTAAPQIAIDAAAGALAKQIKNR